MSGDFAGTDGIKRRFSKAEIDAMRKLAADEEGLGHSLMGLLRKAARNVPFAQDVLAAWYCARDPETPARVKLILISAVAYFVLPIDAMPDLIPLLGFTDDAAVIAAAIATVASAIKPDHKDKARQALVDV